MFIIVKKFALTNEKVSSHVSKKLAGILLLFFCYFQLLAQTITTTSFSIPENTPSVTILTDFSPTSWSIVNGDDQNKFTIDASGVLTFIHPPDFERPSDVFGDNKYKVQVTASDGTNSSTKLITITVTNVNEHPDPPSYLYVISQNKTNTLYWTASTLGGVTGYEIFRSEDSVSWSLLNMVSSAPTSYADNNLTNGKFYFYKVRADSSVVNSVFSNVDGSTPYEVPIIKYMHFDGNGDYMVANDTCKLMSFPFNSSSTIECWVRFATLPSGKATILSKDYNGNSSIAAPFIFQEIYYSSGKFIYKNNGGVLTSPLTNIKTDSSSLVIKPNTWYHIAAVYSYRAGGVNDDSLKLYINGQKQKAVLANTANTMETSTAGMFLNFPLNSRLVIGATTSSVTPITYGNFFNGDICEVRLWTTELTQSQIQTNMNTRRFGNEANMIGLWHLDTLYNRQVYDYDNINFNAIVNGDVCNVTPKVIAVDDAVSVLASSSRYINVRKNDILKLPADVPTSNVLTKIVNGPSHGIASVINKDSISYNPNCFVGTDTIKYLICDTTFFYHPYDYSDTAIVVITAYDDVRPSYAAAPSSRNEYVNSSCAFTIPDYRNEVSATDNCTASGSIVKTQTPVGTTISGHNATQVITMRITDAVGNYHDTTFTITLKDTIRPKFTASPSNHDEYVNSSCQFTIPSYLGSVTATDNCTASGSIVKTQTPVGTTISGHNATQVVSIRITDGVGNYRDTTFTITIKDTIRPGFTASPSDHDEYVNASCQFTIPDYRGSVTATDNCTASGNIIKIQNPLGTLLSGHNTNRVIFIRIQDDAGNYRDTSFIITLKDTIKPQFTASPSSHNEYVNSSCQFTIPDYRSSVSASDNCTASGSIVKTQTPIGTTISGHNTAQVISIRISDGAGNYRDTAFTITLQDTIRPKFTTLPSNHDEYVNSSCQFTIPDYRGSVSVTDNCTASGSIVKTQTPMGTTISEHNTTQVISIHITDGAGNYRDTAFTITLKDTIKPRFTASPSSHDEYVNSSCQFTIPDYRSSVSASDNCTASGSIVKTQTPIGTTISGHNTAQVISIRITDAAGNYRDTAFTITLKDTIRPKFTASPSNHDENVNSSCQFTIPDYRGSVSVTDNCTASGSIVKTQTPMGTTISGHNTAQVISIRISDGAGNFRDTSFTITLKDALKPQLTCTTDKSVQANTGNTYLYSGTGWDVTASDNCTSTPSISYQLFGATTGSGTTLNNITFNPGLTWVRWSATDNAGNVDSCHFIVAVNAPPTDIILSSNTVQDGQPAGTTVGTLSTSDANTSDSFTYTIQPGGDATSFNLSGNVLQTSVSLTYGSKPCYTITIRSTDQGALYFDKTFNIYVGCLNRSDFDWNLIPNGNNPDNQTYVKEGLLMKFRLNSPGGIVNVFNNDNRFQSTRSIVWQQTPGGTSEVSTATIIFSEPVNQFCLNLLNIDYSGKNKDSVIIDPYFSGSRRILSSGEYNASTAVTYKGNNAFVGNTNVANPSTLGNTQVCFLAATDSVVISYGNSSSPIGNNQSIGIGNFNWCEIPNHAPQFIDGSGSPISFRRDTCYEDVTSKVRLKFRDMDSDSVTISMVTAQYGVISGITMTDSSFNYTANPDYNGHDTLRVTIKDNRTYQLTDTLLIYMNINPVNDPPSFTAGSNISANVDAGTQLISSWATGISSGPSNESGQTLTFSLTNNNTGLFSVQPAIDASGNLTFTFNTNVCGMATIDVVLKDNGGTLNGGIDSSAHRTFTITVNDNQNPTITSPADVTVNSDAGSCTATGVTIGLPVTADNCSVSAVTNNAPAAFPVGTTVVTWTVTDTHGNSNFANQSITVVDNQIPTITAPANRTVNSDPGQHTAAGIALGIPVTADNCGVFSVINDAPTAFPAGTTSVTWIVTDVNGNTATATQTITVIDNAPPTITSSNAISITENTTTVLTVTATDPDIGNTLNYNISGGPDAARFNIDAITGVLTFTVAPDYENPTDVNTDNIYVVEIIAADNFGLADTATISVTVTNINDAPTDIILSNNTIHEHEPVGTIIGRLTTIDQDAGDTHMYTILSGIDAASFIISGDTLRTNNIFDYRIRSMYSITLRTTDQGGLYFDKTFIIFINNVNEAPQILDNDNNLADTLYFDAYDCETLQTCLNAFDPDSDQVSITKLYLIDGKSKLINSNNTCFGYSSPNGFTGEVRLFIQVNDNGTPSLCDSAIIIIQVHPRLIISQGISPNGDEMDDTWIAQGIERYPNNKVTIFNRWGDIVYKARGYDNYNVVWKGEYNLGTKTNSIVPDGTYFYILEIEGFNKPISGYVVVKR
jgi:gliding motility-associated-like protein